MPYIRQDDRDSIDLHIETLLMALDRKKRTMHEGHFGGVLNYTITRLLLGTMPKEPAYRHYEAHLGTIEGVKQEFYRRHVAPFEDRKMASNGDVS